VAETVIEEDGDWGEWDFIYDLQSRQFETYNCTAFNTAQSISKLMLRKFGIKFKPSPRWIGIIAGTSASKGGNDPHTVCEAIRKYGLIPDEMLPFSDDLKTVDEYYSFKGADEKTCRAEGSKWLNKWEFKHDWVFNNCDTQSVRTVKMQLALKFCPLGTAVSAWAQNDKGQYIRFGPDNHWTETRAFKVNNAIIDDSYEPFEKELAPEFSYQFVKRYVINKREDAPNWLVDIVKNLYQMTIDIAKKILDIKVEELKKNDMYQPITELPNPVENIYWKMAREYDVENKLKTLGFNVAIQGEIFGNGIQKNPLGVSFQKYVLFINSISIVYTCFLFS
jgi:hypothetical protein